MQSHILSSDLPKILDLSNIDWDKANLDGISSKIYEAAQLWNDGYGTTEISKIIGVVHNTVSNYLKAANDCNLCEYNSVVSEERKKIILQTKNSQKKDFMEFGRA